MTMQNKRRNISATTILMNIIKRFLMFIRPACQLVAMSYAVTFGYRHMRKLAAEIVYNIIAAVSTLIAIFIAMHSFIGCGFCYFSLSFEKRLAILWASDKGDWSHWMTGGRYLLCRDLKNDLISQDSFARLLNNLALNGFGKIIQVILLSICFAIFVALTIILLACIKRFFENVVTIFKKNPLH